LDVGGDNAFVFNDQDLLVLFGEALHGNKSVREIECAEERESLRQFLGRTVGQVVGVPSGPRSLSGRPDGLSTTDGGFSITPRCLLDDQSQVIGSKWIEVVSP
jgi:hypothetical protein